MKEWWEKDIVMGCVMLNNVFVSICGNVDVG